MMILKQYIPYFFVLFLHFFCFGLVSPQEEDSIQNEQTSGQELVQNPEEQNSNNTSDAENATKKHEEEVKSLKREIEKLNLQTNLIRSQNELEREKIRESMEKIILENEKNKLLLEQQRLQHSFEKNKYDKIYESIKRKIALLELEKVQKESELSSIRVGIKKRKLNEEWDAEVNEPIVYTTNPIGNNAIEISDRRIPLNGVITYQLADYIAEKIQYFNNKSNKYPIFLVIDRCPGGSVMAGYKIIKAIQRSQVPVYAVVKSYAASMAAIILLYSHKSYAYHNSIILHHQVSGISVGNITEQEEQLKIVQKWMKRLYQPLIKNMGLSSIEELVKKMYANNSNGDWLEFGDNAVKLKWVSDTVDNIKESSFSKRKPFHHHTGSSFSLKAKTDSKGRKFVPLPQLHSYDFYLISNPNNYYRY